MNRWQILKILKKHRALAEKRAMNFEQNKMAKYLVYVFGGFVMLYLVGFAIILSMAVNEDRSNTPMEFIFGVLPFILAIDFVFRFMAQQTPSQIIKPYVLLPLPKHVCIDSFIATSLLTTGNLTWFAMLVPYAIMSVVFADGLFQTMLFLLIYYLLILANSQWYTIIRTLINDRIYFWAIPIVVYSAVFIPVFISDWDGFFSFYSQIGSAVEAGSIFPLLLSIAVLILLIAINRKIQYRFTRKELMKVEKTTLRSVSNFAFLNHYGETGQYVKLEIKTILRNKNPRKSFFFSSLIVLLMSLAISLTGIYDDSFSTNFWCFYSFAIYGLTMLVKIMGNEGNYIDCLMVRHQDILKLLRAKYIFYCLLLLFPFLLMLPTVLSGKWSFLMVFSYGVFTAGFQHFVLFQLAVYNKQTMPLNTKFISKSGMENNYYQLIVPLFAMFVPVIIVLTLQHTVGTTSTYLLMLLIGMVFMATHPLWLRNIYNRMMKNKYHQMEALRASR